MAKKPALDVTKHILVPKHEICKEKEAKELLERHNVEALQLPRILLSDPALSELEAKEGDIIKISRKSVTAGETVFYRVVVKE